MQASYAATATGAPAARVDAGCGTTNTSPVVTDAAITAADYGKPVTGTGIPAGTTIIGVIPGVSFTMSANATATGTVPVTVASVIDAGAGNTWKHLAVKMLAPYAGQGAASGAQVALETSPDNTAWTQMALATA